MSGCQPTEINIGLSQEFINRITELENDILKLYRSIEKLEKENILRKLNIEARLVRLESMMGNKEKLKLHLESSPNLTGNNIEKLKKENYLIVRDLMKLTERVSELEEWTCKDEDNIYAKLRALKLAIEELKRFQDVAHEEWVLQNKKPHKCPMCDGTTYANPHERICMVDSMNVAGKEVKKGESFASNFCKACEGKGLVWG